MNKNLSINISKKHWAGFVGIIQASKNIGCRILQPMNENWI